MTKHFIVTEIRLTEPVEGEQTIEQLEEFKEYVSQAMRMMTGEDTQVEVEVSYGILEEEDEENEG